MSDERVLAVAHRGDPVTQRENTLGAFEAAVLAGADMVELDLRRTRDAAIVVLHDPTLSRLWGVDQAVADLDLKAVGAIGSGGLRVPTLSEVVGAVDIPLMIDFTSGDVIEGALEVVRRHGAMGRSLFVTGNLDALATLRRRAPEARIGVTWTTAGPVPLEVLQSLGAEFWNPSFELVTSNKVDQAHLAGCKVSTWTVDQTADMVRLAGEGVDAIISNQIAQLRSVLSKR